MLDWFVHHPSDQSFTVVETTLILGTDLPHTVQTLGGTNFHLRRNRQCEAGRNQLETFSGKKDFKLMGEQSQISIILSPYVLVKQWLYSSTSWHFVISSPRDKKS